MNMSQFILKIGLYSLLIFYSVLGFSQDNSIGEGEAVGRIKSFDNKAHTGWVDPDGAGDDIFIPASTVKASGFSFQLGETVAFKIDHNDKGEVFVSYIRPWSRPSLTESND